MKRGLTGSSFPAEILISVGLGLIFVPLSSLALFGVGQEDAGVGSAVLNTTQQIGGSLGTALLNTFFASTVAAYLKNHVTSPAVLTALRPLAYIEGYHTAFRFGACLFVGAVTTVLLLVNAKRDELPIVEAAEAGLAV